MFSTFVAFFVTVIISISFFIISNKKWSQNNQYYQNKDPFSWTKSQIQIGFLNFESHHHIHELHRMIKGRMEKNLFKQKGTGLISNIMVAL